MKVLFIINDGFEESETICPYDILTRAGLDVTIASNTKEAKGSHNVSFTNLADIKKVVYSNYDMLVLPGGPEWKINSKDLNYLNAIKYFMENKALACICATPTILGSMGYLKGKRYTCFPPMNQDFGGTFTASEAEIDCNLITGRSAGSSLVFGFKILEYLCGMEKVEEVKESMFY